MEITKAVLLLMLVFITILTTLTTIAAYAGGDNDDENKQNAEDESQAALNDCNENEVERAGFDCIAIAESEIEQPEESATLFVCKEVEGNQELVPFDFEFSVTGPGVGIQFPGTPLEDPDSDCPPGSNQPGEVAPGEYVIREIDSPFIPTPDSIEVEGDDCIQDPTNPRIATVEIQEGETLTCTFINIYEDNS